LWGNHDTSYWFDEHCSGFQAAHMFDINLLLRNASSIMQVVALIDGVIYAHGGVSRKWMKEAGIKSVEEINESFAVKSQHFRWRGPDPYGDNENEGPLWIRPRSLRKSAVPGYSQVVGHTEIDPEYEHGNRQVFLDEKHWLYLVDSRQHDKVCRVKDGVVKT
jgi:hypothetical protein